MVTAARIFQAIQVARDTANETYGDAMKEWAAKLQQSLIDEGKSLQDAVRITNRVVYELQTTGTLNANLVAELQAIKGNLWDAKGLTDHPVNLVNQMIAGTTEYNVTMSDIANLEREENPLAEYTEAELRRLIADFEPKANAGQGGRIIIGMRGQNPTVKNLNANELAEFLDEARARLSVMETPTTDVVGGNPDFTLDDYNPYETEADRRKAEQERKKEEAAARRAATKAKQEFKTELNDAKGEWESADAQNISDFTAGLKSWTQYLLDKHNAEMKYFDDRKKIYEDWNLQEDEDYQELLKKKAEAEAAWLKKNAALKVEDAKRQQQAEETQAQMDFYTPGNELYGKEEALQQRLFEIRIKYLKQMQAAYNNASEEWHNYQVQIEQAEATEQLRRQKLLAQRVAEWKKQYEYLEAKKRYDLEEELLLEAYNKNLISYEEFLQAQADLRKKYATEYLPQSARPDGNSPKAMDEQKRRDLDRVASLEAQGVISHEQAEKAKERISRNYEKKRLDAVRRFGSQETNQLLDIYEAWKNFFDSTEEDGGNWATRLAALASSVFSVMNAGMQQYSEYVSACAELETAKVEKKYDREIELAEGNSYKVKKAEKEKEAAKAKIKNDANKKMFAMQVIQAVAQTATNALNAYGSAAAIPVVGYILAPIAAAMAVAAGALQIATIKKQQQASEAQGYAEGGFTKPGRKDEPAGVVHAGEWVASQKLVNNPRTRPLLEALDYAQRTNTLGSITHSDVSRSITAPMMIAAQPQSTPAPAVTNIYTSEGERNGDYAVIMKRLADRLDEPFVTVNTVTGDHGIQHAQEEYDKLMRNKAPKSRKNL